MKNASKRIIAMLLALVMMIGILPLSMAANIDPFEDVDENAWYAEYVEYVYDNDLMNGMTDETFEPNGTCTRAMAATVLYRIEDEPEVEDEPSFDDLDENQEWYWDPIAWAEEENIVNGVGEGKFAPNGLVTREQLVTMIWRYAGEEEADDDEWIDEFDDAEAVSDYAIDAFNWGIENKIINGKGDILDPQGNATRAEFAKIITVFDEMNEDDPKPTDPEEKPTNPEEKPTNPEEKPTNPSTPTPPEDKYIAIYNDANGMVMTTAISSYTNSNSGVTKAQLGAAAATLNADGKLETTATNVALFKMETVDGKTTFQTKDGKYLFCDGTNMGFADSKNADCEFILDETEGGHFIRLANFLFNGSKEQYIEYYKNIFTCFGMGEASIYTFTFREVVGGNEEKPTDPKPTTSVEVPDGFVAIFNDANGKVMTTEISSYTNANSGVTKAQLGSADATLNADGTLSTSATNVALFKIETVDGKTTFQTEDGKYLFCDGTNMGFVAEKNENCEFVLEETTGGYFIRLANFLFNGSKEQYIEYYKNIFTCFGMGEASIYTFTFRAVKAGGEDEKPTEPKPTTSVEVPDGFVAIFNDANGKAMTTEISSYTNANSGVTKAQLGSADATLNSDGTISTTAANIALFKIETVDGKTTFQTEDGKYLFCDGTNMGFVAEKNENCEFVLEETTGGYFIRLANFLFNGSKEQYIEYYKNIFTCFGMGEASIYTFTFRVVKAGGEDEKPTEPKPTPPVETPDGVIAIYNDANGRVMTTEISSYTNANSGVTKAQLGSAAAALTAEGKIVTDAANVALFEMETVDGKTTFKAADGTYLFCDGTNMGFVAEKNENCEFVLEQNGNGYFIRLANFLYNGTKEQYIEYYKEIFTCYGMGSDTSIYTFSFREMAAEGEEPTETEPKPTTPPVEVENGEPIDFSALKDGDVIAIVVHTNPEMTDKDFALISTFGKDAYNNAVEFTGTFSDVMAWTVRIIDGKVYLTCGEGVGLYAIDNNNGLRADAAPAAITMDASGYLSLTDPSGNVRYIGVYDNNGGDMTQVSTPNFRCYKNTTNNTKNQTTTLYKLG